MLDEKNYPVYAKIFNLCAIRSDDTLEDPHRILLDSQDRKIELSPSEFKAEIEQEGDDWMNYFDKFGIKEVADVTFYSITRIGDEEIYTPVLLLDSLKVSSLSKSSDTITQKGGYGNASILSWSYTKDIKLKLEDALFS